MGAHLQEGGGVGGWAGGQYEHWEGGGESPGCRLQAAAGRYTQGGFRPSPSPPRAAQPPRPTLLACESLGIACPSLCTVARVAPTSADLNRSPCCCFGGRIARADTQLRKIMRRRRVQSLGGTCNMVRLNWRKYRPAAIVVPEPRRPARPEARHGMLGGRPRSGAAMAGLACMGRQLALNCPLWARAAARGRQAS